MQDSKKSPKIAVWSPSHNFVRLYLRNKGRYRQSEKMLSSNISFTCPHNMVNFSLLAAEIVSLVLGTPANFNGFAAWLRYCSESLNGSQPNFAQCLALTWAGRLYIHFRRLLLHNWILPDAKLTLRPPSLALSYSQRYWTAVEQWARAKLCGVEHRTPPIFGRATIMLGIGPHSSYGRPM